MHSGQHGANKLTIVGVITIATMVSLALLRALLLQRFLTVITYLLPLTIATWILFGYNAWWVLLLTTLNLGGLFYFGFKIYTHEIGLILTLLPLLVSIPFGRRTEERTFGFPKILAVGIAYISIHLAFSLLNAETTTIRDLGSVFRVYFRGIWPFLFGVAFYWYGSAKYVKNALYAMLAATLLRSALGVVGYIEPALLALPGINFIFPAVHTGGSDLRFSGTALLALAIALAPCTTHKGAKAFLYTCAIAACGLVVFGGSRARLAMICVTLTLWLFIQRKWSILITLSVGIVGCLIALNAAPQVLYKTPEMVRRSLSVAVIESRYHDIHAVTGQSDRWHKELTERAASKMMTGPAAFVFGSRVHPYSEAYTTSVSFFYQRLHIAVATGSYESGLWCVLATLGVAGASLYVCFFFHIGRPVVSTLADKRITSHARAVSFLAVNELLLWLLLSWYSGHFPSYEVALFLIARTAVDADEQLEKKQ